MSRLPSAPNTSAPSYFIALCGEGLPLPVGAKRIGACNHPVSGFGGTLIRFKSGAFAIWQYGSIRTINQTEAKKLASYIKEKGNVVAT